ncbi:hypothetical protein WUBG_02719 [Wuchereria bancrofti]|uniref:CD36 family protein n=1 Tax=Wuchereria bancrofti TaxID=6293 RepID=J9EW03_WUCBA|nr:hypothetical protein WUBG_02719 [Wuchereria bancrofti]
MTVERKKCKLKTLYCRTARISLFIIGVILTLFGITMVFLAPHLIDAKIYQQKNIARDNELYHLWENPDYKFSSEIFVYSVKNPHQVLDGNKPEMIKIGPYAYEVSLKKNILGFGNGSVKYQNVHNFTFDKNASCAECSPTREIWIPNIVFQVCAIPFVDIICKSVLKVPKRIGFLMHRNGAQKIVEITTGSSDGSVTAGEILSWDGLKSLPADWWNSKQARKINGTDGEFYKPLIKKTDIIYVFAPDLCRSIHLTFAEEIKYKNILAYRFTVKEDLLDLAIPGNEGFCHNNGKTFFSEDEKCSPRGLLDLSHCYNGTPPILFSFPNFLYADKRVKESVVGLNESSMEHDGIAIEVEPQTGTLLRTYIRSQINIAMWKGRGIIYHADLSRIPNAIVPLFAEYQVVEIGNDSLALLRKMLLLIKEAFVFLCFIPISTDREDNDDNGDNDNNNDDDQNRN